MTEKYARLLLLATLMLTQAAWGAGGVVGEAGSCMMEIGIYSAHFSIYQPEDRGDDVFCEDLPMAGSTLFVMDYLHGSLRQVPVDFRIIRDLDDLGIFARWENVEAMTDLDARTVFYQSPVIKPENQLQVEHRFTESGAYIGIVTAPHPSKDIVYRAVFPFRVGLMPAWLWLFAPLLALVLFFCVRRQFGE